MTSILSRFRRRGHEETAAPQQADATTTATPNPTNAADPEKTTPEQHDIPVSPDSPIGDDEEADLPDDVRELPKIVRNIVSLEDGKRCQERQ